MRRIRSSIERIFSSFLGIVLKFFRTLPRGEGKVSWRARIDGIARNIYVAKGARIRRDAWLICQGKDSKIEIGEGSGISSYVKIKISNNGFIKIGKNCSVHSFSVIYGDGGVTIGDNVRIATHAVIVPNNHKFDDRTRPIYEQGIEYKEIVIGDDVWIGAHVTILAGVTIGSHSVVAAGAVVTKDFPEYSVIGGVPAKVLRTR